MDKNIEKILFDAKLAKEIETKEARLNMYPYLSSLAKEMPSSKVHLIDEDGNSVDEYRFYITVPQKFDHFSNEKFENIKNEINNGIKRFFEGVESAFGKVVMRDRVADIAEYNKDENTLYMDEAEEITPEAYNKILDLAIELGEEMDAIESVLNGDYKTKYDIEYLDEDMLRLCKGQLQEVSDRVYEEIQNILEQQLSNPNRTECAIYTFDKNGDDVLNGDDVTPANYSHNKNHQIDEIERD